VGVTVRGCSLADSQHARRKTNGSRSAYDNADRSLHRLARLDGCGVVLLDLAVPKMDGTAHHPGGRRPIVSQQPNLPIERDDAVEASHQVAARRRDAVAPQAVLAVPQIRPASEGFVYCCDNYL
jgi:hypothetical protein